MELLESVGPRPRQARYQAALRPDEVSFNSSVHCKSSSIPDELTVSQLRQTRFRADHLKMTFLPKIGELLFGM